MADFDIDQPYRTPDVLSRVMAGKPFAPEVSKPYVPYSPLPTPAVTPSGAVTAINQMNWALRFKAANGRLPTGLELQKFQRASAAPQFRGLGNSSGANVSFSDGKMVQGPDE
jgi:hypothetical protein